MISERLKKLFVFLEDSPNDPFLLFAIAKEYEALNEPAASLKHYELLVNEHEDYVGTYYHLGKFYEKLNQLDKALDTYRQGMTVAKQQGDKHAWSELAAAKMELEDNDDFDI
ncbi:MAG: tetratricopeptide repeat-containing protein [Saprospiraceae bacterium]|nr:tetratricopeptide repeat-containing protein [Saprospiraceae bacterium]